MDCLTHDSVLLPHLKAVCVDYLFLCEDGVDEMRTALQAVQTKFGSLGVNWTIGCLQISAMHVLSAMEGTAVAVGVQSVLMLLEDKKLNDQDETMVKRVFPNAEILN